MPRYPIDFMNENAEKPKSFQGQVMTVAKHPLRMAINGDEDKLVDLKNIIAGTDIHEGLKAFIADEIDKLKSNAGSIHLHLLDRPDGGFNLHITLDPKHHGSRKMIQGVAVASKQLT